MTARKTPPAASTPIPKAIAIPYPPATIWKDKEQGVSFAFRGNTFVRRGMHVIRVVAEEAASVAAPALPSSATE